MICQNAWTETRKIETEIGDFVVRRLTEKDNKDLQSFINQLKQQERFKKAANYSFEFLELLKDDNNSETIIDKLTTPQEFEKYIDLQEYNKAIISKELELVLSENPFIKNVGYYIDDEKQEFSACDIFYLPKSEFDKLIAEYIKLKNIEAEELKN